MCSENTNKIRAIVLITKIRARDGKDGSIAASINGPDCAPRDSVLAECNFRLIGSVNHRRYEK